MLVQGGLAMVAQIAMQLFTQPEHQPVMSCYVSVCVAA
jgi:hypothetical protein